jgi:hypothetical protein
MGVKIAAVSAIVYGSISAIKDFVNEAAEAEVVEKRLQFALEASGYAWNSAKQAVDQFANSILETTRFSDEDARRALTDMMLYTNEYAKAETGARLAMDMSIRTGRDLSTTTRLIGMAMTGNVEMLGRYLPQLRNLDAVLGENASMADKAAYALRILQEKFGGTAAKDLDTYSGRVANLKNQWAEFKEELGTGLLPILTQILKAMTDIIESARKVSAFKLRGETYEMGINPETGLPFPVPGGRTPEGYPKESERRFTGWGMGAGVKPDLFAEDYSDVIKKQAEEGARAWGVAAQEELDALEKMFRESAEQQIADNKYKNDRMIEADQELERLREEVITAAYEGQQAAYKANEDLAEEERRIKTDALEEEIRLNNLAIDAKMEEVRRKADLGLLSAQEELRILSGLIEQKYSLELRSLEEISALWEQYPEKWQQVQNQIKAATIKGSSDLTREQSKATMQIQNTWKSVFSQIGSAFTSSIQGMINGTMTWQQAVLNILNSVLNAFLNMFMTMLTNYISTLVAGQTAAISTKSATATANITSSAAEGAAAAAAANSETPYTAIIAAAAMFALIIAYIASVASAAGGWDVDRDSLAFVHKKEMILPAEYAEQFRSMFASGMQPGGGGQIQNITVRNSVRSWDSRDTRRMLLRDGDRMWKHIAAINRRHGYLK